MKNVAFYTGLLVLVMLVGSAYASEVIVSPEPISSTLFLLGGGAMLVKRFLKK